MKKGRAEQKMNKQRNSGRFPKKLCQYLLCSSTINAFTTGNPFGGTHLLGFSIGRGFGSLKGLTAENG